MNIYPVILHFFHFYKLIISLFMLLLPNISEFCREKYCLFTPTSTGVSNLKHVQTLEVVLTMIFACRRYQPLPPFLPESP